MCCVGDTAATADAVATADAAATAKICRAASLARDALIASGGLRTYVPVVSMFVFVTLLLAKTLLPPMLPLALTLLVRPPFSYLQSNMDRFFVYDVTYRSHHCGAVALHFLHCADHP